MKVSDLFTRLIRAVTRRTQQAPLQSTPQPHPAASQYESAAPSRAATQHARFLELCKNAPLSKALIIAALVQAKRERHLFLDEAARVAMLRLDIYLITGDQQSYDGLMSVHFPNGQPITRGVDIRLDHYAERVASFLSNSEVFYCGDSGISRIIFLNHNTGSTAPTIGVTNNSSLEARRRFAQLADVAEF